MRNGIKCTYKTKENELLSTDFIESEIKETEEKIENISCYTVIRKHMFYVTSAILDKMNIFFSNEVNRLIANIIVIIVNETSTLKWWLIYSIRFSRLFLFYNVSSQRLRLASFFCIYWKSYTVCHFYVLLLYSMPFIHQTIPSVWSLFWNRRRIIIYIAPDC